MSIPLWLDLLLHFCFSTLYALAYIRFREPNKSKWPALLVFASGTLIDLDHYKAFPGLFCNLLKGKLEQPVIANINVCHTVGFALLSSAINICYLAENPEYAFLALLSYWTHIGVVDAIVKPGSHANNQLPTFIHKFFWSKIFALPKVFFEMFFLKFPYFN